LIVASATTSRPAISVGQPGGHMDQDFTFALGELCEIGRRFGTRGGQQRHEPVDQMLSG
jgi:hypothetical protein